MNRQLAEKGLKVNSVDGPGEIVKVINSDIVLVKLKNGNFGKFDCGSLKTIKGEQLPSQSASVPAPAPKPEPSNPATKTKSRRKGK